MPYLQPIQQDFENDRRIAIANALRNPGVQPVNKSGAIAQVLANALAQWQENRTRGEYDQKQAAYRQALAGLGGAQTPEAFMQAAMADPYLAQQMAPVLAEQRAKQMFKEPKELSASDLVQIDTPQGPQYVKASDAVGKTAYIKPDRPVKEGIQTVNRGDMVDIYKDGVFVESKPVAARPDTVLRVDSAAINRNEKNAKLPTSALKLQQEELDAIGTASSINADLKSIAAKIAGKDIELGPINNLVNTVRNYSGQGTTQSANFASFKSTLEQSRNASLRLNKGVQTEGDAIRAWNELVQNINDEKVVSQRLEEITKINDRAAKLRRMNVDVIRQNFGVAPLDMTGYEQQQPAIAPPSIPAAASGGDLATAARAERERRRKAKGGQ